MPWWHPQSWYNLNERLESVSVGFSLVDLILVWSCPNNYVDQVWHLPVYKMLFHLCKIIPAFWAIHWGLWRFIGADLICRFGGWHFGCWDQPILPSWRKFWLVFEDLLLTRFCIIGPHDLGRQASWARELVQLTIACRGCESWMNQNLGTVQLLDFYTDP